jgi:hypothetical protein
MSRAISRESFDELKNYLGVYLQQGRVILDSDWNEAQDINASLLRRLTRETMGDGSPNQGFLVDRIFPIPVEVLMAGIGEALSNIEAPSGGGSDGNIFEQMIEAIAGVLAPLIGVCITGVFGFVAQYFFGPLMFFIQFPGESLDDCESLDGWELDSPQGRLRIGRDVPHAGRGFLRLSGHAGPVTIAKRLPEGGVLDLSHFEILIFRFRTNQQVPGPIRIFLEDSSARRTTWTFSNPAVAREQWLAGFATPLDVRFRIVTDSLATAYLEDADGGSFGYQAELGVFGGELPVTWTVSGGTLPPGLTLETPSDPAESYKTRITGSPAALGTSIFTIRVEDAAGAEATRQFTLTVEQTAPAIPVVPIPEALDFLRDAAVFEVSPAGPADPAHVVRYGFELYQSTTTPLVWDIDDLRVGSTALHETRGRNNFIIRGSELDQIAAQVALMGIFQDAQEAGGGAADEPATDVEFDLLDMLNTDFRIAEPSLETAGRMYVDGLPCVLMRDTLYSEQADPDDPPIVTPPPGSGTREDVVYLDVWEREITFVEDPEIREVALGGPDTATRRQVHFRVRVAQGGEMPTGDGRGRGLLTAEGTYTGGDNRLYRVEIETPGNLGTATFRWSDENAATIARVIETVPAGSRSVVVEDASGFHAGDRLLLRAGLRTETARVASVLGNAITLVDPVAAAFPASDRTRIERWSAFAVAIPPDPDDPAVSAAIPLNDGVEVRFGGRSMRRGDYWTFATRHLAGDAAAGIDPVSRIENLGFVRPRGVRHRYAPLARITRRDDDDGRIFRIRDLRPRTGNAVVTDVTLPALTGLTVTGSATQATEHLGGAPLPPAGADSKFVIVLGTLLFVTGSPPSDGRLDLTVAWYNDERTDPATEPNAGRIQDKQISIPLARIQPARDVPLNLTFVGSDTPFTFLPHDVVPTHVEVFATVVGTGYAVELTSTRMTALELKKTR